MASDHTGRMAVIMPRQGVDPYFLQQTLDAYRMERGFVPTSYATINHGNILPLDDYCRALGLPLKIHALLEDNSADSYLQAIHGLLLRTDPQYQFLMMINAPGDLPPNVFNTIKESYGERCVAMLVRPAR